jgi:ankyrin repeat protein
LNFVIHRDNKTLEAAIIAKGSAEQCFLQGENEETALHVAISNDRKETTDLLIAKGYAEQCFLQDEDGKTALHNTLCRYHRDENAASKLIEKGSADQCFLPDKDGKTALHDALDDDRNLEIVKLFLKKDKKKTIEILQSSDSKIAKEILEEIALKKFENGLSLFSSKPRQTSAPEEIQHTKEMSK